MPTAAGSKKRVAALVLGHALAVGGVLFIALMPMPIAVAGVLGATYSLTLFGVLEARTSITVVYAILTFAAMASRLALFSLT